ncbi:MAG: hypothetical protein ACOQNV_02000 [Mycoplasmoidaceae bacterium]
MTNLNKQKFRSPKAAYMGYLFQTFLKRPFGYVIAILYIVYLAVILVIVPAALHFEPLFIWNIGGFNMPIFNLFFIAGSAASIAVAVFRTGRDDGSDLNISAKPLTKGATVGLKTAVYLLIMLIICLITIAIIALVKPIFGEYNEVTNITGITSTKYRGLILSVLVGNLVNMLFFGGISVFISMIGGQVVTIIGTVAIVFVMCLMNFLYPQVISSSLDVLSNKYDATMLSYSCNTLSQLNDSNAHPYNFATIQCFTDDDFVEESHYDTKEYWDLAERESGRKSANYIDFGKQLSSLYSAFGLDESRLKEASKLVIGTNNSYNYSIDALTHVGEPGGHVVEDGDFPICFYTTMHKLGKEYPIVNVVGGDMSLSTSNWYLYSTLFGVDFDTINYVSSVKDDMTITPAIWDTYVKPWSRMKDLTYKTQDHITFAQGLYNNAIEGWSSQEQDADTFVEYTHNIIKNASANPFVADFGKSSYDELQPSEKYIVTAKIHLIWTISAFAYQMTAISDASGLHFPFKSETVMYWYDWKDEEATKANRFNEYVFTEGIAIDDNLNTFSRMVTAKMAYAETYSNLYRYTVSSFYKITNIIAIWTVISGCLFATSVIVYKRTDFK